MGVTVGLCFLLLINVSFFRRSPSLTQSLIPRLSKGPNAKISISIGICNIKVRWKLAQFTKYVLFRLESYRLLASLVDGAALRFCRTCDRKSRSITNYEYLTRAGLLSVYLGAKRDIDEIPQVNSLSMNFDTVSAASLRKPTLRQDFARVSFAWAKRAHRKAHGNHENAESGRKEGYDWSISFWGCDTGKSIDEQEQRNGAQSKIESLQILDNVL